MGEVKGGGLSMFAARRVERLPKLGGFIVQNLMMTASVVHICCVDSIFAIIDGMGWVS